jgi:universal stress protein E
MVAEAPGFRTILIAVADPASRRGIVVQRGAQIAKALGARVILFHAAFDPALSGRPFFDSPRLAKSRGWYVAERTELLERQAAALRRDGLEIDVRVVWEEPAHEAIIRAALREQVDLIVAGPHERSAARPPQLRTTDWQLMRSSPLPLLVVRSALKSHKHTSILAALDPTHTHDKPAALDISIASYAAQLAHCLELTCHLVHCVPAIPNPLAKVTVAARRRLHERVHARLERIAKKSSAESSVVHVLEGNVADTIPKLARKLNAGAMVMGIISRRGLDHLFIGDTAESIISAVPCDVLLIKPDGFRVRLGRSYKEAVVLPSLSRRRE